MQSSGKTVAIPAESGRAHADCPTEGADFFQRQNELILNAAGEGIYGLDLEGRVTFANPAAAAMTGHDVQELLGRRMHALVHHTSREGVGQPAERCAIHAAFVDGAVHHVDDEVFWRKDGTSFDVEYTSTPIREGGVVVGAVVVFQDISARRRAEEELRRALAEVDRLRQRLADENAYLNEEVREAHSFGSIAGESYALRRTLALVERVAPTDTTVLIQGESGTGKELVARALHQLSPRFARALVKVNCGALPPSLVESELFGHEKGAFTGAVGRRRGRFELAHGGTLFLDEVGELPLETQATLLRVLQEREIERVGGTGVLEVDVRVIAATNRDLATMVEQGSFRADLYYRLNVVPITLPPLRERLVDIPHLVDACIRQLSKRLGRRFLGVTPESLERLRRYGWPGNVRELFNIVERAAILGDGPIVDIAAPVDRRRPTARVVPGSEPSRGTPTARGGGPPHPSTRPLIDRERDHIVEALESSRWKIAGADGAAKQLGLHPNTLRSRMRRLGIPTRSERLEASTDSPGWPKE